MTASRAGGGASRAGVWLVAAVLVTGAAITTWQLGLWPGRPPSTPNDAPLATHDSPLPTKGEPWFVDVAAASGLDFHHYDPATPHHYILETMGSGLAWLDYDGDGWPDLFCVQDGPVRPGPGSAPTCKLYRNNGDGTFTDVTEAAGLARAGFGMGCAVGDYDNDGFDDLVVTYWGGVVLYHNEPDGKGGRRFVDVTARAGLKDPHWATSCAWGDVDGDGLLDLYVCNYCEVDLDKYPTCDSGPNHVLISCPPWVFPAVAHRLYRNNGDGTFTDISASSGIAGVSPAPGLGVVMTDLDGDGRLDIYVANDMRPGYLFHNQGGGRFVERALFSGCGLGPGGREVAGMGVDAGDVDGSGRPSLFVTNFHFVPNVLYRNAGNLLFHDWTHRSGLGPPSLDRLGFGTVFCDVDLDGRLDIAVANGHVSRNAPEVYRAGFAQEAQLFMGRGEGRFRDVSSLAGGYFREKRVGRGLAWADYDNDGRPDLAFSHNGGPIALLHNRTDTAHGWLRLELVGDGKRSNRNAVGARVEVEAGGVRQVRFVNGGGSYLSASERRLLLGLGPADRAERVTVHWPSGRKQVFQNLPGRRWWRLHEGNDKPEAVEPKPPKPR
jgi:enediyne biosynthesis protein E4